MTLCKYGPLPSLPISFFAFVSLPDLFLILLYPKMLQLSAISLRAVPPKNVPGVGGGECKVFYVTLPTLFNFF